MRFETSQHMKLGQQMKLAPRMIQSMEILQLPTLALEERIEEELESNITLETAEHDADADQQAQRDAADSEGAPEDRELEIDSDHGVSDFERLDSMESSYGEAFDNEYSAASVMRSFDYEPRTYSASRMAGERDGKMDAMANTAARSASYVEQLLEQWSLVEVDDNILAAGELLISFIEDDGFIRTDLQTIADRAPAGDARPDVKLLGRALECLQMTLEPVGIGARDTRECLLLQLDSIGHEATGELLQMVRLLITDHLDDMAQNRRPAIANKTGLSIEQINEAITWMKRLSVSPGRALVNESPPAIIPDAIIEYDEDEDHYLAYLNDRRLPNLQINKEYARMVRDRSVEKKTRDFLRKNLTNAQWLIEAVAQRCQTLQRVLNVVVEAQRDYFDLGASALKPLPMTQVADQLGVHVATVSRAVSGKYVQTPRGVLPLRGFFSGGTQTDSGEEMSWEAVKASLREVVDAEDKSSPLSDEALAAALRERGVDIARRTVAKYRSQLDIPSARMRKRY